MSTTAFNELVFGQSKELMEIAKRELQEERALPLAEAFGDEYWQRIHQRFACLVIQSRAAECRHLAGQLLMKVGTPEAQAFAKNLTDRSHALETIAMEWAKQWPPEMREAPGKLVLIQ
jgi:hypothetical protein